MDFERLSPLFFLGPILLIPIISYAFTLVKRPLWTMRAALALRLLGILLLVLAFCQPSAKLSSRNAHVIFLLDVSESVELASAKKACATIVRLKEGLRMGDSSSVFAFADGIRELNLQKLEETLKKWDSGASDDKFRGETRIADSLLSARLSFPAGKAKRMLLISDGAETAKELAPAFAQLRKEGVDVLALDLDGIAKPEAALVSFSANTSEAFKGEMLRFDVRATANEKMGAKLRISNKSVVLKEIPIELEKGQQTKSIFEFPAREGLGEEWTAEIVPERDFFPINNSASCRVRIKGGARVFALHVKPERLRPFAKAMREQDIEIELRGRTGLPATVREMLEFDAIILADFPATYMTSSQMEAIKSYVNDFGGGLMMMGSENSFGLGGYFKTPVEDVLPALSRYQKEKELPSLAMVLVIDKSGSMDGEKVALARESAKAAVELLGQHDSVGVVAFDGEPYKVSEVTSAMNASSVIGAIDSISAGGGTNMHPAMQMGKEMLDAANAKIKHMIILSDGMSMPGEFLELATEMADKSMTVSTVALGTDSDRELMSKIADLGRGRYYETTDPSSMPRIFAKETVEASRSAIKEEPFNAIRIGSAQILDGIAFENSPPLFGYVMTRARPGAKVHLLTESGDPLLATGRFGLGNSAAFSSDATTQWASEWIDWNGYGKFWSQVLRSVMRSAQAQGISVERSENGGTSTLRVRCADEAGVPRDFIQWDASLCPDDGPQVKLELRQTGCGLYEVSFPTPEQGSCSVRLGDTGDGKLKTLELSKGCPKEYMLGAERQEAFKGLARLDSSHGILEKLNTVKTQMPLRNYLCALALLCLIGGVLMRRL